MSGISFPIPQNLFFTSMDDDFTSYYTSYMDEMPNPKRRKQIERSQPCTDPIIPSDPITQFLTAFQPAESQQVLFEPLPLEDKFEPKPEPDCQPEHARAKRPRTNPGTNPTRRIWVKDRSRAWWDKYNSPDISDAEFRQAFRMSRATFDAICNELNSAIAKEDTPLRTAIPVRQRVAACIWRLATGEPLRDVSRRFGLGISTCHKLVLEVCSAIKEVLMPRLVQWPDVQHAEAIAARFKEASGIPNVVGAMYTTHVPIIAPKENVAAYFNRHHTERNQKTSYTVTVQGVVDADGIFTDVCIGWPGSMPDDKVLEKSALYQRAVTGSLGNMWVAGGCGYPLMDWVMVPYAQANLTWAQHAFNEKIGGVNRVAEEAFARLKGRWKCLQKRTEVKLLDLPVVMGACCVLHNVCEAMGEVMDEELRYELVDDVVAPEVSLRSVGSKQKRDAIAHNLLHRVASPGNGGQYDWNLRI